MFINMGLPLDSCDGKHWQSMPVVHQIDTLTYSNPVYVMNGEHISELARLEMPITSTLFTVPNWEWLPEWAWCFGKFFHLELWNHIHPDVLIQLEQDK